MSDDPNDMLPGERSLTRRERIDPLGIIADNPRIRERAHSCLLEIHDVARRHGFDIREDSEINLIGRLDPPHREEHIRAAPRTA